MTAIPIVLFVAVIASLPLFGAFERMIHYMNLIFFFAALTGAWNLISGFAGQLSLGHSGFFAVGAYTSTLLYMNHGITPWIGMVIGGILSLPTAFLIGYPTFRLRGTYFVLSTLALAEVIRRLIMYFKGLTKGSVGISLPVTGDPRLLQFPSETGYYYLFFGMALLMVYLAWRIRWSRLGYFILGIREDEDAAESLGVNARKNKLIVFMISAFFTAIMGSMYAQWKCYIDPDAVGGIELSIQIALAGILGGMGTVWGPFAGATILILAHVFGLGLSGGLVGGVYMLYGALLVLAILVLPQGVVGAIEEGYQGLMALLFRRRENRGAA